MRRAFGVVLLVVATMSATALGAIDAGAAPTGAPPAASPATSPSQDPGSSRAYEATLARYAAQHVDWTPCFDDGSSPDFQCASIAVPMDWFHPAKGDLEVAISRILATGTRHGLLETNPGGPGGSGTWVPQYLQSVEPDVAAHFDLVGMDPRGVAASTPLECQGTSALDQLYSLDGRDRSPGNTARFLQLSKQEADGCATDRLTPYINTDQTVRDVDLVRAIFGDRKTSWLGYSGGTWMGARYATLFPSRVDRFVLDGNIDFTTTWYYGFRGQAAGFQRRFDQDLLPWLAKYDDVFDLGTTPARVNATFELRRAALNRHPLVLADGSRLSGVDYESAIVGYLYSGVYFPDVGYGLSIIERYATASPDDQAFATELFAPVPLDQSEHVFWAVQCNDTPMPPHSVLFSDWQAFGAKYPLTGASWLGEPCAYWKQPAVGSPVTGKGIPPLLMIQNDGDPATPYAGGLQAHRSTPGSVLLTVRHEGDHTIYGAGDQCVEDVTNAWLVQGVLPRHDLSCEGIPLPERTSSAASASAAARTTVAAPAVAAQSFAVPSGVTPQVWERQHTSAPPKHL
jgi:pimeloyl-ACP methyl ester carboxylesterase